MSQGMIAPEKAITQRFETCLICLSSTQSRLSDGVEHINSHAHNNKIKILDFYTT